MSYSTFFKDLIIIDKINISDLKNRNSQIKKTNKT